MTGDAFDILGLPLAFDLDRAAIERAFLSRAIAAHPDLAGEESADGSLASKLNDAKRLLLDPEARANLLLARLGGPTASQEKSLPPTLLAEFMEAREGVDAAVAAADEAELGRWKGWAKLGRDAVIADCRRLIDQAISGSPDARLLRDIRVKLNAWRSYERMIEQMDAR